jgi:hypothetical protein
MPLLAGDETQGPGTVVRSPPDAAPPHDEEPAMFDRIIRTFGHTTAPTRTRRPRWHRPELDPLEGRMLLSLYASEFRVNSPTYTTLSHNLNQDSANASSANGMSVVVWDHTFSSTDHDIYAQLYDSSGRPKGPQITVDSTSSDDTLPKVAMDAYGDFVVAWDRATGSGNAAVVARMYNSAGTPTKSAFYVALDNWASDYDPPGVAMDANGDFVVAYTWSDSISPTNYHNIAATYYNSAGTPVDFINVASWTRATVTQPSVAMAPDGHFAIAYTYDDWSRTDNGIRINQYAAPGNLLETNLVAASGFDVRSPSVAMDNDDNVVVAYEKVSNTTWNYDIEAVRVTNLGFQSGEITVASTPDDELRPSVALNPTTGAFAVAYTDEGWSGGAHVDVVEVSPSDRVTDRYNCGPESDGASISMDGSGYYMLTYTRFESSGDWNIYGRFGYLS